MECSVVQDELIAYHFATLSDATRDALEAHLTGCAGCLRAYLLLKRQIEGGAAAPAEQPRPSEAARRRLRAAVQAEFRPVPWRRLAALFSRPIPLYQGLCAAVLATVLLAAAPPLLAQLGRRAVIPAGPAQAVDSARQLADNVRTY